MSLVLGPYEFNFQNFSYKAFLSKFFKPKALGAFCYTRFNAAQYSLGLRC